MRANGFVEYTFKDLNEIADYLQKRAEDRRQYAAARRSPKSRMSIEAIAEATAYESIADLLRGTKLETFEDFRRSVEARQKTYGSRIPSRQSLTDNPKPDSTS